MVSLGWSSPTGEGDADVSVLLLTADGKVRSDADFYFYNNPVAADGSVQLLGKTPTSDGNEDRITFDLTAIPADVEQVVVAASRYNGGRFGDLDDVRVTLADGSGEGLLRFSIEDAGAVGALLFGELYRRSGDWKFRAIGQGYESGLAGLAQDYGVDVDDDAEEAEAAEETGAAVAEDVPPEEIPAEAAAEPVATEAGPEAATATEVEAVGTAVPLAAVPAPSPVPVVEQIVTESVEAPAKSVPRPRTAKK
ncbi:TerD family protein, partial [Streptomyces sp. WAC 06725]|uniref:TerD family protein n=1 Tax=Streptomyces sp. WAC 06725 TaxID=2203209 RepID=UPI0021ADF55E